MNEYFNISSMFFYLCGPEDDLVGRVETCRKYLRNAVQHLC